MTDDELRNLVRESIARLGARREAVPETSGAIVRAHASQALFVIGSGGDADGACLIEPAVRCNHCGYCQTYGH